MILQAGEGQLSVNGPSQDKHSTWPGLHSTSLSTLKSAMSFIHSEQVTWYPKFGCALLAVGSDGNGGRGSCTEVNEFTLYMVSLDAWSHRLHRSVVLASTAMAVDRNTPINHTCTCASVRV